MARTGFASQQTKQPRRRDAASTLWEPADGDDGHDLGAHGPFDDKAVNRGPQLWASHHHSVISLAAVGIASTIGALYRRRR